MIRTELPVTASPRESLAAALGGELIGRDAITVGANCVWASVAGVVRVNGIPLGTWSDPTDVLAAEYRAAVSRG